MSMLFNGTGIANEGRQTPLRLDCHDVSVIGALITSTLVLEHATHVHGQENVPNDSV